MNPVANAVCWKDDAGVPGGSCCNPGRIVAYRRRACRSPATPGRRSVEKALTLKGPTTPDRPSASHSRRRQGPRRSTIEPGGVFGPIHDHKDRPGIVYILQGTITDHRDGVATDYGPGLGWPEDRNTTHWLENRGTIPAVEISVDVVRAD